MGEQNKKVVVFGIDGGSFNVMRPLLQKGDLPYLASLISDGVEAELISTIPFVTPTAFASFMTGVNPGKHGIFDFTSDSHSSYDTGPIVNYSNIRIKTLWELLTEYGKHINLITVPFTHPPTPLNGAVVCLGNMTEGRLRTYPPEMVHEIVNHIGGYEERYCKAIWAPNGVPSEALLNDYIDLCYYQAKKSKQAALHLLKTHPWDFLMIVFVITDRFQHYFWRHMDPHHPAHDPVSGRKRGTLIADSYRMVDKSIGDILKVLPEKETNIIVMSDHGFGPLNYAFYTNRWLEQMGLLCTHKKKTEWALRTPTLERCAEKIGFSTLVKQFPKQIGKIPIPILIRKPKILVDSIDWTRTEAYATRWGININLRSREPHGIVKPGQEYETLVDSIIKGILDIQNPRTGMPLFDLVLRKEEIYYGPYMNEAHDILIASHGIVLRKDPCQLDALQDITAVDLGNGDHIKEGILIMKGPLIKPKAKIDTPKLEDLAPTILYLMDLPIPDYMDGRVLTSCIKQDALSRQPVVLSSSASCNREAKGQLDKEADRDEDERIRQQLKNLGYIE